jgi:polysaccharide export outer membrane protein
MDGDPAADLALRPNDTIYVPELETSYFTVLGGVQKPGQYPLKGKMSLSEAIGLAGGAIPQGGDLASVSVTRSTEKGKPGQTIKVNLKDVIAKAEEQPIVQRGDVVYVKEKKPPTPWMQVLGALTPLGYWLFPR